LNDHKVTKPVGAGKLSSLSTKLTIEQIVRSSVAHYLHFGLKENHFEDMQGKIPGFLQNNEGIQDIGGSIAGLFNIPVARCDFGECIPNEARGDVNFPCIVGPYDNWNPPVPKPGNPDDEVSCPAILN
jgi:hypothetical protein